MCYRGELTGNRDNLHNLGTFLYELYCKPSIFLTFMYVGIHQHMPIHQVHIGMRSCAAVHI